MNIGLVVTVIAMAIVLAAAIIILTPVRGLLKKNTALKDYELLMDITETGVRWAKQWMQTSTGEAKKSEVEEFIQKKAYALGLEVSAEDIDKAIEAVYEQVKKEI